MPWRKCTCRPTRGGRVDPGCGDPDRRTGGIRLRVMARRRGAVFRPSVSSHTRTLAHMLAPLYDGTDFRPSRNGDGVAPAATHRLRECGRAMTRRRGQFADLRYPFTPTLAHKLARAVDGQILDHPETVMGMRRLARAVCEGVTARWRDGAGRLLTLGIRSLRCLHTHWRGRSMGGRRDGLLSIEKQWWDGARGSTKSARVSESDGATSQAVWLPLVSGCTDGCTHLSVGGGLHRFSGIEKRCWDCAGGRAQSARVLESATARRRRLCAGLGCFQSHRCVRTSWRGRWT